MSARCMLVWAVVGLFLVVGGECGWGQLELPKKVYSVNRLDEAMERAKEKGKLLALLFYDAGARRKEVGKTMDLVDLVDGFSVVVGVQRGDIRGLTESLKVGLSSNLIGGSPPAVAVYSWDGREHVASLSSRTIDAMGEDAVRDFKQAVRGYRERVKGGGGVEE